jgi:hypothetical protein
LLTSSSRGADPAGEPRQGKLAVAEGSSTWLTTINFIAVARAPIDAVLGAAFDAEHPHAIAFEKRYDGTY